MKKKLSKLTVDKWCGVTPTNDVDCAEDKARQNESQLARYAGDWLGSVIDFSDLPEDQSTNGQIRKSHRLIKQLYLRVCELERQIQQQSAKDAPKKAPQSQP